MINKITTLSALLLVSCCTMAQIRFSANPAAITRTPDAILTITATSQYTNARLGDILVAIAEENSGQPVFTAVFSKVMVQPGLNSLSSFGRQLGKQFYENELSSIVKSTGNFAPGNYTVCCQFVPEDKLQSNETGEQCFNSSVMPRTPLTLIQPAGDICNKRPSFSWQGRKSVASGSAFKVVCVEVNKGQSPEEALQNNAPILNEMVYQQANQIAYPMGSPVLNEGKAYAWQVLEVAGKTMVNSSDIFEFTLQCEEVSQSTVQSYAEVKPMYTGKRYYFTNSINFSFSNPYVAKKLDYAVVHVASQKKLNKLPELMMQPGLNKMSITTGDIKGLIKGQEYKIEIYNLASTTHYINFIIKE